MVYIRLQDTVGLVSLPISDTIWLDTTTGSEYGISINEGDIYKQNNRNAFDWCKSANKSDAS